MNSFDYVRCSTTADVADTLGENRLALAGGTDLLPLLKDGLRTPELLVDIKRSGLPAGIEEDGAGIRIGALTTLAEVEHHAGLRERFTLLSEAAAVTATRQLRNRATLGGNLLQSSRCWYYRHPDLECWLRGGSECFAQSGCNQRHAIVANTPCATVHPSDLAGCLVALDARIELSSNRGEREVALADFLTVPSEAHRRLHDLRNDEVLCAIVIPARSATTRSTYIKAMSRKAWSFALVGVAMVLETDGGKIADANIVLNGIAPTPWRIAPEPSATALLSPGDLVESLASQLEAEATPLAGNAYKLALARGLIKQAVDAIMAGARSD